MKHQELWDKFENHLLNEQVTQKRKNKLKCMFRVVSRELNLKTAKRKQIEEFVTKLNKNEFKKLDGNDFSGSSKSDIKKFLKQFYKWLRGKGEFYPKEVSWLRTKIGKDDLPQEKEVITQEEVMKLASHFNRPEYRMLTLLLFDSGFRKDEMFSVRKRDLTWDDFDDEGNKCWWIKCSSSKTEVRTIPIQLFTEDINNFVNGAYFLSLKDNDLIFNESYEYYLRSIKHAGYKVLNKKITPHSLRHSSATLYAKLYQGDMIQLANRYGWSYSSRELRTYIRRSKSYHSMGAKKVFSSELLKMKEDNKKLRDRVENVENLIRKIAKEDIKRRKK